MIALAGLALFTGMVCILRARRPARATAPVPRDEKS